MNPELDSATGVPIGIAVTELQRALQENPIAILLTEPGYLGTLSDLKPLIAAAHEKSIPVIVDAAWDTPLGRLELNMVHVLRKAPSDAPAFDGLLRLPMFEGSVEDVVPAKGDGGKH
jgi:arginine/lysine/ornithine decarboxylase